MDAAIRFARALDADRRIGDPELLPDRLVRAADAALPVDGAVLSVHDEVGRRTPLAASNEMAATAERLEFTTGYGPCLAATEAGLPLFATEELLAHRWPIFHDLLVTRTTVRSILALPLPGRLRGVGAMDLYFRHPAGPTTIDVVEARHVAGLVVGELGAAADRSAETDTEAPLWLDTTATRRRGRLWVAVGMVIAAQQMTTGDALALLRGYAYATGRTVDDLADDLLERRIAPEYLRGDVERPPTGPSPLAGEVQKPAGRTADRQPIHRQSRSARLAGDASRETSGGRDGHVLLLYRGERERRAGLTAWVRRGLDRGEKVICTGTNGADEPLFTVLEAGGGDVAAAIRSGQLDVLPVQQFYPPGGQRVLVERALAQGFPAVRLSAEARAALTVLSPAAHRESERRMHELVQTHPVSVLCQYPRATTHGTRLEETVAVHLTGVYQSTLAAGGKGDGLVLRGEIDTANADVFAALLAAADRAASRELSLDLTGVTYLDAGAGRRLNDATRRFRAAGGQVVLVAPQPPVERTLTLLDLGDLPGMQLMGGQP